MESIKVDKHLEDEFNVYNRHKTLLNKKSGDKSYGIHNESGLKNLIKKRIEIANKKFDGNQPEEEEENSL
jgi:hypothetical protein